MLRIVSFASASAAAAALALTAAPAGAAAPLELGPVAPGGDPVAAAGDFNGDGHADLAIGSEQGAPLSLTIVFGAPGMASLTAPAGSDAALRVSFPDQPDVNAIYPSPVGDVDGDGFDDVGVALNPTAGTPNQGRGGKLVLRGAPGGGALVWPDAGGRWLGLGPGGGGPSLPERLGDIDGDATDDVLITYLYSGATPCAAPAVASFPGPCPGVRRGPDLSASQRIVTDPDATRVYEAAPLGDVDGDGRAEIAGFLGLAGWRVLHAHPEPGETLPTTMTAFRDGTAWARPVAIGDVNGDGLEDLALAGTSAVFLGRAGIDGETFDVAALPAPTRALPPGFSAIGPAGDLDGDGFGDVLLRRDADRTLVVLPGGPTTAAWQPEDASPVPAPVDAADAADPVSDVDGDGRDELVVSEYVCDPTCRTVSALAGVASPAQVEAMRLSPTAFGTGGYRPSWRQGTRITTRLTAAARVRFTVTPWFGGAPRAFELDRPAGTSSLAWDGRVDGTRLRPGLYRITATTPGAGEAERDQTVLVLW